MSGKFRPVYGRDHPKTQAVLKRNSDENPTVTDEDRKRWAEMEEERRRKYGLRDWGPEKKEDNVEK